MRIFKKKSVCFIAIFFWLFISSCANKETFEIIYYSNLNGNIEACECYEDRLGGLQNIKPAIDKLRKKNTNLIVIDGGDTFNTYPFLELDQAIVDAYKIIKPDIWVPGEQEFIEGDSFFKNAADYIPSSFITGNFSINDISTVTQKKYKFKSENIVITSYILPSVFKGMNPEPGVIFEPQKFKKEINSLNPDNYNILVFHGDKEAMLDHVNLISSFDLVLTSHQQSADIDLNSKPVIIGGGQDGEYLLHIILQKSGREFKINASKINMEQSDNPDKKIVDIISAYRDQIGLTE